MIALHFKRFWWAYGLAVALVAIPFAIVRAQKLPSLDLKSVEVICHRIDEAVVARYGKPISAEYDKADDPLAEVFQLQYDPRLERVVKYIPLGGVPSLAEDARTVKAAYGPFLEPYDRLDRTGIYYQTFAELQERIAACTTEEEVRNLIGGDVVNFLALLNRAKLYRSLAGEAITRRDWPEALAQLDRCAHTGDPVRVNYMIGHLIAVAGRTIAYGGYADLLKADPPEAVLRQALAALTELRQTDPTDSPLMWMAHKRCSMGLIIIRPLAQERFSEAPSYSLDSMAGIIGLGETLMHIVLRRDQIQDERLRAWADRFWENHLEPRIKKPSLSFMFMIDIMKRNPSWTLRLSTRRWICEVIESQPELLANDVFPVETIQSLDPLTFAILTPGSPQIGVNSLEVTMRSRSMLTQGRILEAAFAARLFEREHGRWPEGLVDLTPAYFPALEEGYVDDEGKGIFTPIQMGWLDMTPELQSTLLSEWVPLKSLKGTGAYHKINADRLEILGAFAMWPIESPIESGDTFTIIADPKNPGKPMVTKLDENRIPFNVYENKYLTNPVLPLAVTEAMQAHPRLFSDAEALIPRVTLKGRKPGVNPGEPLTLANAEFDIQFDPLDADYARRVTDETDVLFWSQPNKDLPPDKPGEKKPNLKERTVQPPRQVMVRSRLTVPERVFTIWSPGPDGQDDGGQIAYDATNGSISRGDLLAFPERF